MLCHLCLHGTPVGECMFGLLDGWRCINETIPRHMTVFRRSACAKKTKDKQVLQSERIHPEAYVDVVGTSALENHLLSMLITSADLHLSRLDFRRIRGHHKDQEIQDRRDAL